MCGILGGTNPEWCYETSIDTMKHRGPDGNRIIRWQNFTLAFARLAIIDLNEVSMQPMLSCDREYAIVFNGEIYDYNKLKEELKEKGYQFSTKSDTEVVLNAYIEWKDDFINHFDGIFAIAIYCIAEKKVKIFRDRTGVKPLYYYYDGRNFAFASELKGIKKLCNNVKFQVDNTAIYDYMNFLYIPEPKTCYKYVYKLQPAHQLSFNLKNYKIEYIQEYWKLHINTNEGNKISKTRKEELSEELRDILNRVIRKQLEADVKVGTFLSGGVDSSIVTTVAHDLDSSLESFSIGFKDKRYDEIRFAENVIRENEIAGNIKYFGMDSFNHLFHMLPQLYDEPFADTSAFPTYMLSEFARKKIVVALTGDGADEIFGGYSRCELVKNLDNMLKLNSPGISNLCNRVAESINLNDKWRMFFEEDIAIIAQKYLFHIKPDKRKVRKLLNIQSDYDDYWNLRKYYHKELPPITRMKYVDFKTYLPGDILTKVDRASMAVSLEARVPFLDKEVVEFAFKLTQEECCPEGELKGLLKYAYRDIVNRENLYRKKMGFSIPYKLTGKQISPQENILKKLWPDLYNFKSKS